MSTAIAGVSNRSLDQTDICTTCQQPRPLKEFLVSPHLPSGRLEKCIACIRGAAAADREQRQQRIDRIKRKSQSERAQRERARRDDDIRDAGDAQSAILGHYHRPDGRYDIDAAAHDLARWPPIAARIKELKRASRT